MGDKPFIEFDQDKAKIALHISKQYATNKEKYRGDERYLKKIQAQSIKGFHKGFVMISFYMR